LKNLKANQRSLLIYEFGVLVQPFEELYKRDLSPIIDDYRIAIAKVQAGDNQWRQNVRTFASFAKDIIFHQEYQDISHVPERFRGSIGHLINDSNLSENIDDLHSKFKIEFEIIKKSFFELINRIPINWEPVIFEANTPFTSYLRIRESIAIVNDRLHYFDRYLKEDFFYLFLNSLNNSISVRLVTTSGNNDYGIKNVTHISNLARQQFTDYQLIKIDPKELHDRNLRVDDHIFTLGPGVDRAGMALTNFGPSDSSKAAHQVFDDIISKGNVVHKS